MTVFPLFLNGLYNFRAGPLFISPVSSFFFFLLLHYLTSRSLTCLSAFPVFFLFKGTTMAHRSPPPSPTWSSPTWWIRCCSTRTTAARFPGSAPLQSAKWTGRTARSPRRKTMMRGHRWSMDCLVSKCQSTECHVK